MTAFTIALCFYSASTVFSNSISSVSVEPTFECAGVIVTLSGTDNPGKVTLEVKKEGEADFKPAHDFTRYDNYHLATSLFDLEPGSTCTIRVTQGSQTMERTFSTRPEFSLPAPLRTVRVSNNPQLVAAIENAKAGDEILLSGGTYTGGLTISKSGTAGHPIVIRGEGLPEIDGSGYDTVIHITGNYVILDSLNIKNTRLKAVNLDSNGYCVVQKCQITGASSGWNQFVYINGGGLSGGRHLIQDNHLSDTGSGFGYGINLNNFAGPGTIIRRNTLTGFFDGINPSGDEEDINDTDVPETHSDILSKWPNYGTEIYENTIRISRDDDIEVDGIAVNMRIFRNYLSTGAGDSCTNAFSIAPVAPGPFFIVRNVVSNFREGGVKYNTLSGRGTIRNCYFYHNTFKNNEGTAQRGTLLTLWEGDGDGGSPSKNTVYMNNIFMGDQKLIQRLVTTHTPDYRSNYWHTKLDSGTIYQWGKAGPYYGSFEAWRTSTGQEAQGFYGDPGVDAVFNLNEDSPAVDKGVFIAGINDGYSGNAPDMGAYEHMFAVTPDTATAVPPGTGTVSDITQPSTATVTNTDNGTGNDITDTTTADNNTGTTTVNITPDTTTVETSTTTTVATQLPGTIETLANAFGFPNPWEPGNPYSAKVQFRNLTPNTRIMIFTVMGELVREIFVPYSTEAQWDVAADDAATGIYICVFSNDKGERKKYKLAVIR